MPRLFVGTARVGSPSLPLSQIHRDALERLNKFQTTTLPPLHTTVESHPTNWLPPPPLLLKSNCDGAIFHGLNCAGLGIVIRNSEGSVIAALSERVPLLPSVDDLEAMAWRRSVTFAIETGLQEVIFEEDSEVVYKHLSATSSSMASFGHITDETRLLVSNLRFASFSHVKRSGNAVADKPAKLAKNSSDPQI
ncbi:uncharacterized protein LOC126704001 [Quercus robur]|uniref:uncharacterized protein LOC126704001 n=1 Tax=Quercus robur TaxID=38942 RepID=UPI002161264E|nr:uncharacterized protein LOC126704001 [Quercus robur]